MQASDLLSIAREYRDHLSQVADDPSLQPIPLPTKTLQKALRGLRPDEVTVLGGFEGHGKSALAQQIAFETAKRFSEEDQDLPDDQRRLVLYHSLEMGKFQLMSRFLVQATGMKLDSLLNPQRLSPDDWERLEDELREMGQYPLWVFDSAKQSTSDLNRAVSDIRSSRQGIPKLMVVDYFHLLSDCPVGDVAKLDAGIMDLKNLARLDKLHVIAIVRCNRALERGDLPNSHNIAGSQGIAYSADNVVFVHRPALTDSTVEEEWENYAKLIVTKARNGPLGRYDLIWVGDNLSYRDLAEREESRSRGPTRERTNRYYS